MNRFRLVPPLWLLLAVGLAILLHRQWPVAQVIVPPWHWSGLLFVVPAIAIAAPGARALIRRGTTILPFGDPTALVTDGPFRYSRNPLYLSMALLLLGVVIFLGSLSPLLAMPAFVAVINALFIRPEEAKLTAAFGGDFRDYCSRVRRWL